jgi:glycosyltransferase involved in cell wall biosynthesis
VTPSRLPNNPERPLRVQFVTTSLPVGGAETLLLNLLRRMDKQCFSPEVICLKEGGELATDFAREEIPLVANWLRSKWDISIVYRLARYFSRSGTDAVITVGAGDKMFWGRLAAKLAGVPVICSALHSTGWPDGVGFLNRLLTPITDGFISVAEPHCKHLVEIEKFPQERVFMIPNGVDTDRFRPNHALRNWIRKSLGLPHNCGLVGIVAALREEKNHTQFVDAAREVHRQHPNTHFLIVGDGPERGAIESRILENGLAGHVHLLGTRQDTESILAGLDVFCLTSRNEANPVSILEALSCGIPVVAPDVGSIRETVLPQQTGILSEPLCYQSTAAGILQLLDNPRFASTMGLAGRQLVRASWSLESMVDGYEFMLRTLYRSKLGQPNAVDHAVTLDQHHSLTQAEPTAAVEQPLPTQAVMVIETTPTSSSFTSA